MPPYFSVIIPTFNREHLLSRVLTAFEQQNFVDFECLIIDDGSTDKTAFVVEKFSHDQRFKYFVKQNGGAASARNYGLKKASGKITSYFDSDDFPYPSYLEITHNEFEKYPNTQYAIMHPNRRLEWFDSNGKLKKYAKMSANQKQNLVVEDYLNWHVKPCGGGIFHRKHNALQWDENFMLLEDLDFIFQLELCFPCQSHMINWAGFEYRQRQDTLSLCGSAQNKDWIAAFERLIKKHNSHPSLTEPQRYKDRIAKYKTQP